ncbi:MAG: transposase zinc-binding domain-containing protein [Deltaproteobacteria bacterium]|nr:transposase zinc-binding domain-containing protein [Deltaproteobacteria bacterium]
MFHFTLKQILQQNWCSFLDVYHLLVQWYAAYNVWKVINCREPDGLGYATFACPVHPSEFCHVPRSCKSRFCSVCAKVQIFLKNDLCLMLYLLQVRKQSFQNHLQKLKLSANIHSEKSFDKMYVIS